jgi:hypothetical protein
MASLAVEKLNRLLGKQPVNPKNLEHYYYLGLAYERLGKTREAVETFKRVMAERYGYEDVGERLARLSQAPGPTQPRAEARQPAPPPGPVALETAPTVVSPQPVPPAVSPKPPEIAAPPPQAAAKAPSPAKPPIQVTEALGKGLLGPTYKGTDTRSGRPVAVKFLRPELLQDREVVQAFLAEARLARALEHPQVVRLLGLAEIGGRRAVVMEYVEGFDLAKLFARNKRLTMRQALDLLSFLASTLGHAHKNKLLHRDLKMSNVLVAKGGKLRVSGIGLGALRTHKLGRADGYPPPEFLRGEKPDERTDIYALGAMLFHGLSGLHPESPEVTSAGKPPSLRSLMPDVPEALDQLISRCLAEQPAARFHNMTDLAAAAQAL